ncbi:MAG: hypothetical protein KC912_17665 [Proteobacteria bacterium]|nr:hypothetical protein [Pseudomonadota bacterium]
MTEKEGSKTTLVVGVVVVVLGAVLCLPALAIVVIAAVTIVGQQLDAEFQEIERDMGALQIEAFEVGLEPGSPSIHEERRV